MIVQAGPGPEDEVEDLIARVRASNDPRRLADLAAEAARNLAPNELRRLYLALEALRDPGRVRLFRAKAQLWNRMLREEPPRFENLRLSSHARLFVSEGPAKADKALLVGFTGAGGGVFMSTARLLNRLPAGAFDVLWLRTADDHDYPHGVPGFGDDFAGLCRNIAPIAQGYAGAAAMGASLGGYWALRAAIVLDLRMGVSLAGRFNLFKWIADKDDVPAFDPLCGCMRPTRAELRAYFAVNEQVDAWHAARLESIHPGVAVIPVQGARDHSVVSLMVADGSFDRLVREVRQACVRLD